MSKIILIVEDDLPLQKSLSMLLQDEGFATITASTGAESLFKIDKHTPDLVLLDLGLPDIQGETVLAKLRQDYPNLVVIILTAKSKPQEVASGLNLGANDYLAKPFAIEELLARINARIRDTNGTGDILQIADLTLDTSKMLVTRNGDEISLTRTEFNLLHFLMLNKGHVLERDVILNHVWGYSPDVESRVVDIYIGYLRKKIDDKYERKLLKNKRGFGYLIDD